MRIKNWGPRKDVYESVQGRMMIENSDIAEILYLTKVLGNYNITKIGSTFIFENEGNAVALEKI